MCHYIKKKLLMQLLLVFDLYKLIQLVLQQEQLLLLQVLLQELPGLLQPELLLLQALLQVLPGLLQLELLLHLLQEPLQEPRPSLVDRWSHECSG